MTVGYQSLYREVLLPMKVVVIPFFDTKSYYKPTETTLKPTGFTQV
jgi:hypothetical protein